MLTQKLEKLDALDCCDMEYLRSTRKQLTDLINHSLNTLDSKRSLKSDSKSPVDGLTNQNKELNKDISDPPKQTSEKVKKINFDETEESDIDSDSRDEVDSRFSKQTISSVLGCEIPDSDFFSKDINSTAQFELKMGVFDALYKERKDRCFKKGTWQKYFVDGLKQSNPYCVFSFQHHQISIAEKRKRKSGSKTFYANAECAFKKTCPVKVNIEMFDKTTVYVKYTGNVKHQLNEIHARHVSGEEREQLKEQFKGGIKPLTKYLDAMDKTSAEVLVSGNVDGIGKNSRVFAQIACESRQDGRKHDDTLQSLLYQQEDMKRSCSVGFIQKVCAQPLYVFYWSKAGLTLYHEKSSTNALFWDATGSVCRRNHDGKQMLYYKMAIKHPVKGKMGIPVTSMLSSDQSLSIVCDWIRSFRHGEKKLFGFSNLTTPKLIISDQSMVFILAALHEFNGDDTSSFLTRCWKIANGTACTSESKKTIVHLCASHFMNSCKKYILKKIGKKNKTTYMYMVGLLMNCQKITDAQELLKDIYTALLSPTINDLNTENIDRLYRKINNYETSAESEFDFEVGKTDTDE